MDYSQNTSILFLFLLISPILSELYHLQKVPARLKTLHRAHRNLSPQNDSYFLEQAYGDSYDLYYYYTTLYFGPKKTPQTFILDTGSPTTTSPCSKCTSCGKHLNKPYELKDNSKIIKCYTDDCNSLGSSCMNNQCSFSISYSEGSSLAGFFNLQDIYFENINNDPKFSSKSFTLPIGCTTTETHLFVTQQADGIMGLNNSGRSFVSLMFKYKVIQKELFSICLGQKDGYFSIGEIDTKYHKSNISYVPLIWGHSNFFIKILDMKVGNVVVSSKNYNIFIDSGTTITYFPNEIYNSVIDNFKSYCKEKGNKCGKFQDVENIGHCGMFKSKKERFEALNYYWPNITLNLEGYSYILTPNNYYFEYNDNNKIGACIGFEGEYSSKITLGGTFMHGHDIIFDKDNQMIGFAEADCNRGMNVEERTNNNEITPDDSFIKNVEGGNPNKFIELNEKLKIGIIIISCVLIVFLIVLIIFILVKKFNTKEYKAHVDESAENKNGNNENNINNVLENKNENNENNIKNELEIKNENNIDNESEIKNQNTATNDINNV